MDFVFHLAGIKGSPAVALNKPASFFVPTILFNTCLIDAAIKQKVRHVLYTSSIEFTHLQRFSMKMMLGLLSHRKTIGCRLGEKNGGTSTSGLQYRK